MKGRLPTPISRKVGRSVCGYGLDWLEFFRTSFNPLISSPMINTWEDTEAKLNFTRRARRLGILAS